MNTVQIQVTCGGIEPQFLKQELFPLQHKYCLPKKNTQTIPTPKCGSLIRYQKLCATCSTIYVHCWWNMKSMNQSVHKPICLTTSLDNWNQL
jgi:hypothetical protein